jgi:hypothetical protein
MPLGAKVAGLPVLMGNMRCILVHAGEPLASAILASSRKNRSLT